MIVWMLSTAAAGALIALAARAVEEGVSGLGRPRRWVWTASILLSLLLPVAGALLPLPDLLPGLAGADGASLELLQRLGDPAAAAGSAVADPRGSGALDRALAVGWALSSTGLLALVLLTGRRLRAQARRGSRLEVEGLPVVVSEAAGPAVIGMLRPAVVLPAWVLTAEERERALVVHHEWEHVRAGDARLLGLATLALVAMPWNLPLWWQHRRLRLAVETDCDARVLAGGADARAYGAMLLRTAGRGSPLPLAAPSLVTSRTLLERRILAMTQKNPKHPVARVLPLSVLALALVAGACELSGNRPASSPTEPSRPNLLIVPAPEEAPAPEQAPLPEEAPATEPVPEPMEAVETVEVVNGEPVKIRVRRLTPAQAGSPEARGAAEFQATAAPGEVQPAGEKGSLRVLAGSGGVPPLILLDGREIPSADEIDPQTIARIEVVKGAAAVEQYGDKARGGVIRITTKTP